MVATGTPRRQLGSAPSRWGRAVLGEVAVLIRQGKACGRHSRSGPGLLHLRPMNVTRDGQLDLSDCRFIDEAYAGEFPRVSPGDVLFNNTNSRELVGKTTTIEGDEDLAFSNHMTLLRFPRVISHRFMGYQLQFFWMSGGFKPLLKQYVNQASVSMRVLRNLQVALPPSAEQDRIAEAVERLLGRVRNAVGLLEGSRMKIERYNRAVLRAAVGGALTPLEQERSNDSTRIGLGAGKARADDSVKEAGSSRRTSRRAGSSSTPAPGAPHGWSVVRVDEVGETRLGLQRHPGRHTGRNLRPYLRVANVFDNKIDVEDVKYMNFEPREYNRYELRPGDILLNEGQSLTLVGRPAMYRGELEDVCFQNTLIRFRAHAVVEAEFALIVFRHYFYTGRFSEIARWSTNIAHMGLGRFSALPFPLPPIDEQRRICAVARDLLDGVAVQAEAIPELFGRLEMLRFAILSRALSGRLVEPESSDADAEGLVAAFRAAAARGKAVPRKQAVGRRSSSHRRKRQEERELSLIEVLRQTGGHLPAKELLARSTYDENSIDEFYSVLAQEVREGRIREGSRTRAKSTESFDPESVVELVK